MGEVYKNNAGYDLVIFGRLVKDGETFEVPEGEKANFSHIGIEKVSEQKKKKDE